jgi:hypothetical protein
MPLSRFILQIVLKVIISRALAAFYTIFKLKMISRRPGGGDEAYYTYVEEADNCANKDSALI